VVAVLLQNPIAFTVSGVLLTILAPIIRVAFSPGALAISLIGLIIGIGGHLFSLPLGFPGLLTRLGRTEALGLDAGIGHKTTPTMGTANLAIHGFLLSEAVHLKRGFSRKNKN
jgi:hypothetical protein